MSGMERVIDEAGDIYSRPCLLFLPVVLGCSLLVSGLSLGKFQFVSYVRFST